MLAQQLAEVACEQAAFPHHLLAVDDREIDVACGEQRTSMRVCVCLCVARQASNQDSIASARPPGVHRSSAPTGSCSAPASAMLVESCRPRGGKRGWFKQPSAQCSPHGIQLVAALRPTLATHLPCHKVRCKAWCQLANVVAAQVARAAVHRNLQRLSHPHALHVACGRTKERHW